MTIGIMIGTITCTVIAFIEIKPWKGWLITISKNLFGRFSPKNKLLRAMAEMEIPKESWGIFGDIRHNVIKLVRETETIVAIDEEATPGMSIDELRIITGVRLDSIEVFRVREEGNTYQSVTMLEQMSIRMLAAALRLTLEVQNKRRSYVDDSSKVSKWVR